MSPGSNDAPNRHIVELESELIQEFGSRIEHQVISKITRETFSSMESQATVRDYLGMLARRANRRRLVALAGEASTPPPSGPEVRLEQSAAKHTSASDDRVSA